MVAASLTDTHVVLMADPSAVCPLVLMNVPEKDGKEFERSFPKYLEEMTGATFPVQVVEQGAPIPVPAIILELLSSIPPEQGKLLVRDEFRIRTEEGRVVISSPSVRGLHYGFYDLMERFGCRFWSFSEQDIPKVQKLQMSKLDYTWKAPFLIHDIMSKEAQTGQNNFGYTSRAVSPVEFTGSHTLYTLLTPYAKEHPEIYPLVQSINPDTQAVIREERKANDLHFCYSAPGIAEALAAALAKEVEKRKGDLTKFIYFAGMGDWYGGQCQCDRCQKIYEEEAWTNADGTVLPGYTATLLRMINQTAEILDKEYPGIQVGTFAYMSLEAPPAKTRPRENVVIYVPRLRHCGVHPVNQCAKNRQFWLSLQRWCELAPGRVYVWEYGANFTNFLYPFPTLSAMSENIGAYYKLGVAGVMIQGNYVSTGGDMVVLNNYVFSRMMRDPSQNIRQLIESSIAGYYGPAAPAVMEYMQKLEASVATIHVDEFSEPAKYLTPEIQLALKESLAKARDSVSSPEHEKYRHRVDELAVGLEAVELWKQGPLVEKDGRLVRKDFNGDTYARAVRLSQNNRNSTPREFGTGRGYWLDFLRWHGGPLARIEKGSLVVKAAPAQNAAVGPIAFNGKVLVSKTWFPSIRHGEFPGEGSEHIIRMSGETGIGAWSPNTKYIITQEIRVLGTDTVEVTAWVERKIEESSASFEIRTLYPNQNARFEYRSLDGKWVVAGKPTLAAPIKTGQVDAWKVSSVAGEVTDIYEALAKQPAEPPPAGTVKDSGQKPAPFSGEIGIDSESNKIYTSIVIPVNGIPKDEKFAWLRRTIAFSAPEKK